ncbi:SIR2 family protein [Rhizobium johnstonii]|uniref:SIR2 family protein n=1 Tax=Rhizobium johnstonii TaxID=3019933 RepID=UPI003F9452A6
MRPPLRPPRNTTQDWPFPTLGTLESSSEQKAGKLARALLNRALDTGRAVAFVGAGVSMAYGRISWFDLIYNAQESVKTEFDSLNIVDQQRLATARDRLRALEIDPQKTNDSSMFPAVFQAAELLDAEIRNLRPLTHITLRERTAKLVENDIGHARELLVSAFGADKKRPRLSDSQVLSAFGLNDLKERLGSSEAKSIFWHLSEDLQREGQAETACALPVRRYIHAALYRIAPKRNGIRSKFLKEPSVTAGNWALPFERDPLAIIHDRLRISRFLTTNYDHEIEHTLTRQGYSVVCDWQAKADSPAGSSGTPAATATDLSVSKASKLLAFCCRDRGKERGPMAEIIHLHGQAHHPEELALVDDDYRKRYLSLGAYRKTANDAQRMALSANPIIFVGFGMTEDDVLRPLREFVGERDRSPERIAIALMPNLRKDSTLRERVLLPQRYGVLPIHFGSASMAPAASTAGDKDEGANTDWLQHLASLRKLLSDLLLAAPTSRNTEACRRKIAAALGNFGGGFSDGALMLHPPRRIEGILIERPESRSLSIETEIAVINDVIAFLTSSAGIAGVKLEDAFDALKIALAGATDAIISAFLCARLLRARVDRDEWRNSWLRLPQPRTVRHDEVKEDGIPVVLRHMLSLPSIENGDDALRFFRSAPSRMMHLLLASMRTRQSVITSAGGRRHFLLMARRGVGKGHFFSSLADTEKAGPLSRIRELIDGPAGTVSRAAFYNLSFSNEIGSVFDGVISEIANFARDGLKEGLRQQFESDLSTLESDRVGRLEFCLQILSSPPRHRKRLLIGINGLSSLFDIEGKAKNGQITKITSLLFGEKGEKASIDFFLIVSERNVPSLFRNVPTIKLARPDIDEKSKQEVLRRLTGAGLNIVEPNGGLQCSSFVHVLHEALASLVGLTFFPAATLMSAYTIMVGANLLVTRTADLANVFASGYERRLQRAVHKLLKDPRVYNASKLLVPRIIVALAATLLSSGDPADILEKIVASLPSNSDRDWPAAFQAALLTAAAPLSEGDFEDMANLVDEHFHALFQQIGSGRYALTLLFASSSEHFCEYRGSTITTEDLNHAAFRLKRYQDRVLNDIRNPSDRTGEDILIDHALRRMRRRYFEARSKLDATIKLSGVTLEYQRKASEAHALLESIIWHLAAIGQPVAADVLFECPILRTRVNALLPTDSGDTDAREILDYHLRLLVVRGFAFQLANTDPRDQEKPQYAIHRLLQRQMFRSLGAPFVEYPYADQFTITMFATQPNDLPSLDRQAHEELWRTVTTLIRFRAGLGSQTLDLNGLDLEARRLRAAFGILRSIYSVAVIARFPQTHDGGALDQDLGIVEGHRQIVRWITRQAIELDDQINVVAPARAGEYRAFYAEDIVWLFNECGVLSYMQGRLSDASFTLELARRAAQSYIEPTDNGPIRVRVGLNRAAVEIDAGRATRNGSETVAALERISNLQDEHQVPILLARGYLALIGHLRGERDVTSTRYAEVIRDLRKLNRSRAASIFSRHFADLMRSAGEFDRAQELVEDAINLALDGGHEDVRYDALMSKLRIPYSTKNVSWQSEHFMKEMEKTRQSLAAIERYADVMGLPRLSVDALTLKARMQLASGDLDKSVEDVIAAVQIATLNDMRLRKLSAVLVLSQIYSRRDRTSAAPLVDLARDLAKRYEATAARAHVDNLTAH